MTKIQNNLNLEKKTEILMVQESKIEPIIDKKLSLFRMTTVKIPRNKNDNLKLQKFYKNQFWEGNCDSS